MSAELSKNQREQERVETNLLMRVVRLCICVGWAAMVVMRCGEYWGSGGSGGVGEWGGVESRWLVAFRGEDEVRGE